MVKTRYEKRNRDRYMQTLTLNDAFSCIGLYFKNNGPASARQVADALGIDVRLVKDYISLQMAAKRLEDIDD